MKSYLVDSEGYYGEFGGAYVPEILHQCVSDLQEAYLPILESEAFQREFRALLRDYVGRPSPLYRARRLSERYGAQIYLKRVGKRRIIAETGAGQHGVATATVCALMDMECVVYMGETDVKRQRVNVEKMKMLGATVVPVTSGNKTLKDATNEAIRDWCCHPSDTFYIIGSTVGPHPYPDMVARLQSVISEEIKGQLQEHVGRDYPDYLMACVGGGSNAGGTIYHYIDDPRVSIGPMHANLAAQGRARVIPINDDEAVAAAFELTRLEGIIPALESAHALAALGKMDFRPEDIVVLTVSGRGDKDIETYLNYIKK